MTQNDKNLRTGRNAVEVRGLVKHYGTTKALDGVDLDVREGTAPGVRGLVRLGAGQGGAGRSPPARAIAQHPQPEGLQGFGSGWPARSAAGSGRAMPWCARPSSVTTPSSGELAPAHETFSPCHPYCRGLQPPSSTQEYHR